MDVGIEQGLRNSKPLIAYSDARTCGVNIQMMPAIYFQSLSLVLFPKILVFEETADSAILWLTRLLKNKHFASNLLENHAQQPNSFHPLTCMHGMQTLWRKCTNFQANFPEKVILTDTLPRCSGRKKCWDLKQLFCKKFYEEEINSRILGIY